MTAADKLTSIYHAIARAADEDKSFVNFDLGLAPEAMTDMNALKVREISEYSNFGETNLLRNDIARFLESQGNAPDLSGRVADVLDQVAKDAISATHAEAAFFTLRGFTPIDEFNVPRWHTDGWFYEPTENTSQKKIALTLKGPKTLLNNLPDSLREVFHKLLRSFQSDTTENRRTLEKLVNPADTQIPLPGQGTIFTVGDIEHSAVHSEPPIDSERLFMSVVPGTRAQIEELRQRWNVPPTTYSLAPVPPPQGPQMP
ncbi:MAG: hypothetical protein JWO78_955 [Micavibrio sp.]|nr:hypothetical protein [Micavibrio sp.]